MTRALVGRGFGLGGATGVLTLAVACVCGSTAEAAEAPHQILEEIVVTSTRRPLALSDVPRAMSVLSERDLDETGVRSFRDHLSSVPGVAFSDTGSADVKITVRGISADIYSEVRDLTAVYLDEVPITNPGTHQIIQSSLNPYLVDIRQVEMLRGPQGTLFGANSMGGTLRIATNRPESSRYTTSRGMTGRLQMIVKPPKLQFRDLWTFAIQKREASSECTWRNRRPD